MADLDEVKHELDEIWKELRTKQERVKPAAVVMFLLWIIGATVSGAWWAATTSQQLQTLSKTMTEGAKAQYSIGTAVQDFRLRDQRIDFLQQQINTHVDGDKEAHRQFRDQLNAHEKKLQQLEMKK